MLSFKSTAFAVALAFATVAQSDYVIDPNSVPISTRRSWCQDEKRICDAICREMDPKAPLVNDCSPEALTYGCICGDGNKPNVSEYSLSLPYFTCTEWGNQCVKACKDNICASKCREDNPCGAQNPTKPNTTASETTAAPSATNTADEAESEPVNFRNAADSLQSFEIGRVYGMTVVLGALFAGFAML